MYHPDPPDLGEAWDRGDDESPLRPLSLARISQADLAYPTPTSTPSSPKSPPVRSSVGHPDADPDCPTCRGAGYWLYAVPYGHPKFCETQRCQCLQANLVAERSARQSARVAALTATLHAEMGELRDWRLDQLDVRREYTPVTWRGDLYTPTEQARMLARAISLARTFEPKGEGLYIFGSNGTGKSHVAAGLLNACAERGIAGRYGTSLGILRLLRQGFGDHSTDDRIEALISTPLLVVDDLGAEEEGFGTFSGKALFDLLKSRSQAGRATVYTANLPCEEQPDPRISSLIKRECLLIPLITSDYGEIIQRRRAG
jgi:DNA replication protein DnaC